MRLTEQRKTLNNTDKISEMNRGTLVRREIGTLGEVVNDYPRQLTRMRGTAS